MSPADAFTASGSPSDFHDRASILIDERLDFASVRRQRDEADTVSGHDPGVCPRRSDPIEEECAAQSGGGAAEHARRRAGRRRNTVSFGQHPRANRVRDGQRLFELDDAR